jgi:hypothetical protein
MQKLNTVGATMYQKAIKLAGQWVILLDSATRQNPGVIQFRNSSRKAANVWRDLNEPMSPAYQLNATAGAAVWRARGNV